MDGLPEANDFLKFRLPLRGARCHLSPTLINAFNKFSVRFYVRLAFKTVSMEVEEDEEIEVEKTKYSDLLELLFWR